MQITKKLNIVIADDNAGDQYLFRRTILEISPCHCVTSVYHGAQLLELLLKKGQYSNITDALPDCIFLDLKMPILDGFEAFKQLKQNNELKNIPVFIVSGLSESIKVDSVFSRANGILKKTEDYEVLKEIIRSALNEAGKFRAKFLL